MPIAIIDIETLARNWWVVALRGVAGVLFGIFTFFAPGISIAALVLLFGAYALVDGVLAIASAFRRRGIGRWWVLLLEGVVDVAAAVVTFVWPAITALALLYVIAVWALLTGILEIAAAIRLRRVITGEWLLVLSGVLSLVLGVLLIAFPSAGAVAVVVWIGAYALVFGLLLIVLGFRLRAWARGGSPRAAPGAA